jgi:hypothetical protein
MIGRLCSVSSFVDAFVHCAVPTEGESSITAFLHFCKAIGRCVAPSCVKTAPSMVSVVLERSGRRPDTLGHELDVDRTSSV